MIDWQHIETVLLDMDGTLLDLRFDQVFWNELLPARFARHHGVPESTAQERIGAHMRRVRQHLDFYCIDAWSRFAGFDVALLHESLPHLIGYRPAARQFVARLLTMAKDVRLVTNAHRASLSVKHRVTGIEDHLPHVYSAHDFGHAKEDQRFWHALRARHDFDPARTLLIDDTEVVLDAARQFGIAHTIAIMTPDSGRAARVVERHAGITHFAELMPGLTSEELLAGGHVPNPETGP